jgi:hypothetical protein
MYNELQNSSQGTAEVVEGFSNAIEGVLKGGDKRGLVGSDNSRESSNDSGSAMPWLMGGGDRGGKGRGETSEIAVRTQIKRAAGRVGKDFREQPGTENNKPAHSSVRAEIRTGALKAFNEMHGLATRNGWLAD